MRRYFVLLLITGTFWARTDFDKLVYVINYENLSIVGKAFYDAKKIKKMDFISPSSLSDICLFKIWCSSNYQIRGLGISSNT